MIEPVRGDLGAMSSAVHQSLFYYAPRPESDETLALMQMVDTAFHDLPFLPDRAGLYYRKARGSIPVVRPARLRVIGDARYFTAGATTPHSRRAPAFPVGSVL